MKKTIKKRPLCYLRTHRRVWGLTVKELATLMGYRSASHMSRIEHGIQTPGIEVAFACQVLFGIPPAEMFPHVFAMVEDKVMWHISEFHSALEGSTSLSGTRKRSLCEQALQRAIAKPSPLEVV